VRRHTQRGKRKRQEKTPGALPKVRAGARTPPRGAPIAAIPAEKTGPAPSILQVPGSSESSRPNLGTADGWKRKAPRFRRPVTPPLRSANPAGPGWPAPGPCRKGISLLSPRDSAEASRRFPLSFRLFPHRVPEAPGPPSTG